MAASIAETSGLGSDTNVTRADQAKINRFSCLNMRLEELVVEKKTAEKELENIEEAINEILLADDHLDAVNVAVGDIYIRMEDKDAAQEWLEERKKEHNASLKDLNSKCDTIKEEMQALKVQLYKQFGNNINLESDD